MITFDEMFVVIENTFVIFGLSEIHLKKFRRTETFLLVQRIVYTVGLVHLLLLVFGEVVQFTTLIYDEISSYDRYLKITDLMPCFLVSTLAAFKSFTMVWKKDKIRDLVENLRLMWPNEHDEEIDKIIYESMVPTKKFFWIYTLVTNVLSMVYNIFPLIVMAVQYWKYNNQIFLLPYYIWYPYSWNESALVYTITYLSQCYAGIFTTSAVSSVDCFFCLMVAYLCMHFKMLCNEILKINCVKINNGCSKKPELKLQKIFRFHTKLIRLCREVEAIFSFVLLLNLLFSSLMICLLMFSATISPPARIVKYLLFLSSSLTQIMMMSWYGNKLIEESSGVARAAYESQWIGTGRDHCKGIMMLQVRGAQPLTISAMGFTTISLSTLTSILSTAWSYFTLLRTVYQKHAE